MHNYVVQNYDATQAKAGVHLAVLGGSCRPLLIVQVLQASGLSGPAQLPRLVRSAQLL